MKTVRYIELIECETKTMRHIFTNLKLVERVINGSVGKEFFYIPFKKCNLNSYDN